MWVLRSLKGHVLHSAVLSGGSSCTVCGCSNLSRHILHLAVPSGGSRCIVRVLESLMGHILHLALHLEWYLEEAGGLLVLESLKGHILHLAALSGGSRCTVWVFASLKGHILHPSAPSGVVPGRSRSTAQVLESLKAAWPCSGTRWGTWAQDGGLRFSG